MQELKNHALVAALDVYLGLPKDEKIPCAQRKNKETEGVGNGWKYILQMIHCKVGIIFLIVRCYFQMTGGQNDYDVNVSAPHWSTYSLQSKSCEYFLLHSLAQIYIFALSKIKESL